MTGGRLASEIQTRIEQVNGRYDKLVLVVGPPESGKTEALLQVAGSAGYPYVSLGLELSRRLLDVPARQRPLQTSNIVGAIVEETHASVVLLDNIELLFDPSLALNPLLLLRRHSRNRVVVAVWPGSVDGNWITYAAPTHREHRRYWLEQTVVALA